LADGNLRSALRVVAVPFAGGSPGLHITRRPEPGSQHTAANVTAGGINVVR
jgi:hypothetical protein